MGWWADPSNPTTQEASDSLGNWGQFDPFRTGDAAHFQWLGGTEDQYRNMTPEQRAQYKQMVTPGTGGYLGGMFNNKSSDYQKAKDWLTHLGQGGAGAAPASASPSTAPTVAGGAPGSGPMAELGGYTQAATPSVNTPFASQQWTIDANGNPHLTSTLGGQLGNANTSLQQQYADLLRQPVPSGEGARNQAINAAYGQATSRLDPQWDKRQDALRTQLLNQGLDPTSEAGKSAMGDFGRDRNDAYSSAMNGAILQGDQAGNDVFRNSLMQRNSYLQQLSGLHGLSAPQNFPSLLNAYIAQQNFKLGRETNQQANTADWLGAAGNIGASAAKNLPSLWSGGAQGTPGGPLGYDNSGTPYYSNPGDWELPQFPT